MILHRKRGWKPNQKVLEWKERKYQEQEKRKKHQNPRRKKRIFIYNFRAFNILVMIDIKYHFLKSTLTSHTF